MLIVIPEYSSFFGFIVSCRSAFNDYFKTAALIAADVQGVNQIFWNKKLFVLHLKVRLRFMAYAVLFISSFVINDFYLRLSLGLNDLSK